MTEPFIPLGAVLAPDRVPEGRWLVSSLTDALSRVLVGIPEVTLAGGTATLALTVAIDGVLEVALPGLPEIAFLLGSEGTMTTTTFVAEADAATGAFIGAKVKVPLGLRLATDVVRPAVVNGGKVEVVPGPYTTTVGMVTLRIDPELDVTVTVDAPSAVSPFTIGDTGLYVELAGVDFVLDDAAPKKGLALSSAKLTFPEWQQSVAVTNAFIGYGGFSGTVDWTNPPTITYEGFALDLTKVMMTFEQSLPTAMDVTGNLTVPFFDGPVAVRLAWAPDGTVSVSLAAPNTKLHLGPVTELTVEHLSFEHGPAGASASLGGTLMPYTDWPTVHVPSLRVRPDGGIEIPGGWLELSSQKALNIGPFGFELNRIGLGVDGSLLWLGFTGGIKLHAALPAAASVKGLRVSYDTATQATSVSCEGAGIAFSIPETLDVAGSLAFDSDGPVFSGAIAFKVLPVNLAIAAGFKVGVARGVHFWGASLGVELPAGIPIFNTGLALYEIAALAASQLRPERAAGEEWFPSWYLRPNHAGVADFEKWGPKAGSVAIGLGAAVGTLPDDGYLVLAKALLLVTVPGPMVFLDGRVNMLRRRAESGTLLAAGSVPLFRALAVFDGAAGDVKLGVNANLQYQLNQGDLLEVGGNAEAYFHFRRPDLWHLYLGTDRGPLRGKILKDVLGLEADAFWMVDNTSLRIGAGVGIKRDWSFEVRIFGHRIGAGVHAAGYAAFRASLIWKPTQAEGSLSAGADVRVKAFGRQIIRLTLDGSATGRAPHPFSVALELQATLDLPTPLPDPTIAIALEWKEEVPPPLPVLVSGVDTVRNAVGARAALTVVADHTADASGYWTGATALPAGTSTRVELDSRPQVAFARPVKDEAKWPGWVTPPVATTGPFTMTYSVREIRLSKVGTAAAVPGFAVSWQHSGGRQGLLVEAWARTPMANVGNAADGGLSALQAITDRAAALPCGPTQHHLDVTFDPVAAGTTFASTFEHGGVLWQYWVPPPAGRELEVVQHPWNDPRTGAAHAHGLLIGSSMGHPMVIRLPWPAERVSLLVDHGDQFEFTPLGRGIDPYVLPDPGGIRELTFTGEEITGIRVEVSGVVILRLSADEAMPGDAAWMRETTASAVERLVADQAAFSREFELLEPNTQYELVVKTRAVRQGPSAATIDMTHRALLHTTGPPASLTPYVASRLPAMGARPVYRGYDLGLDFTVEYVHRMYSGAAALTVDVVDENAASILAAGAKAPVWGTSNEPALTAAERRWTAIVNRSSCGAIKVDRRCETARLEGFLLRPLARHTAKVVSAGTVVDEWDFVSSAYAGFTHQVSDARPEPFVANLNAGPGADPLAAAVAEGTLDGFTSRWLPAGFRPLPTQLEVTVLRQNGVGRALLVEGPEPIEWPRVSLSVTRSASRREVQLAPGSPVRIVDAVVDPPTRWSAFGAPRYSAEWIELVTLDDVDLGGWRLQHTTRYRRRPAYRTYFTFPAGTTAGPGTRLRVHSGPPVPFPHDDGVVHLFTGSRHWWLNNTGETVRLVAPDGGGGGRVVETIDLPARYRAMPAPSRVTSADGTRAVFVFAQSLGGTYRLTFTFARSKAGLPTLSRGGSTAPEIGVVTVAV